MSRKSLKDISWQVSELEYRQDSALSYSTLAKYEREGFNNLSKLFERVESPSLTFGSIVDILITGTEEEFNSSFMVAQLDNSLSDTLVAITKRLFYAWKDNFSSLNDIPDDTVIDTIKDIPWNNHWLPKTRAKKIKEDCSGYYQLLYIAGDRTIISTYSYQEALNLVYKLKSSPATMFYFKEDPFDDNIERLYQLKFKATFEGIDYRCMADELIVFHKEKIVVPIDLKTSSKPEWDFHKSFLDWNYYIQAKLYWNIIRENMDKDPYYKDFKLAEYRFIVANKTTLTPLVWVYEGTSSNEEVTTKNGTVIRSPFTIGGELKSYLDNSPAVPNGINIDKPNNIEDWI